MKGLAIVSKGIEDIAAQEIKEISKCKTNEKEGAVIFDFKDYKELVRLCYRMQSADRVMLLLGEGKFKTIEDVKKKAASSDYGDFVRKDSAFRVSCKRIGVHYFSSAEMEAEVGEAVIEKTNAKVDLENPDAVVFVYVVDDNFYLGVDFTGFDANKRDYKIFTTASSIRGTTGYALLREAGYGKKDVLLDPFVGDGTVVIEAALYAIKKPVNFYRKEKFAFNKFEFLKIDFNDIFEKEDKKIAKEKTGINGYDAAFKNVDFAKKNAKIAGVEKLVWMSRVDAEWLDIKFGKKDINRIITKIPEISKRTNIKDVEKTQNEFFYQAEFILKDKGTIGLLMNHPDSIKEVAGKHKFVIKKTRKVFMGGSEHYFVLLEKLK